MLAWKCNNILSFFVVHINAAVKNVKVFSTATEMQQWVPFALLSIYKMLHTAIADVIYLGFHTKCLIF
jgi:hypothetical protein